MRVLTAMIDSINLPFYPGIYTKYRNASSEIQEYVHQYWIAMTV